jgi:hypothetical protein
VPNAKCGQIVVKILDDNVWTTLDEMVRTLRQSNGIPFTVEDILRLWINIGIDSWEDSKAQAIIEYCDSDDEFWDITLGKIGTDQGDEGAGEEVHVHGRRVGRPREHPQRRLDLQLRDEQWAEVDLLVRGFGLTQRQAIRWFVDHGIAALSKVEANGWEEGPRLSERGGRQLRSSVIGQIRRPRTPAPESRRERRAWLD